MVFRHSSKRLLQTETILTKEGSIIVKTAQCQNCTSYFSWAAPDLIRLDQVSLFPSILLLTFNALAFTKILKSHFCSALRLS